MVQLVTKFRRQIVSERATAPRLIQSNLDNYAIFALQTRLQRFLLPGEALFTKTIPIDDAMVVIVVVLFAGVELELSPERTRKMQSFIDKFDSDEAQVIDVKGLVNARRVLDTWDFAVPWRLVRGRYVLANLRGISSYQQHLDDLNIGLYRAMVSN